MDKYARFVEILWALQPTVMFLLLAMNVPSPFAGLVMSMSEEMEINVVLNARADIRDLKVSFIVLCHFRRFLFVSANSGEVYTAPQDKVIGPMVRGSIMPQCPWYFLYPTFVGSHI